MANRRVSLKGRGADIFFGDYSAEEQVPPTSDAPLQDADALSLPGGAPDIDRPPVPDPDRARLAASEPASSQAREQASALARNHTRRPVGGAAEAADLIELIRKTVKTPGKEVSYVRLTAGEKARLTDIIYAYKQRGKRTSETDIARIGLNYMLEDYERRGGASTLARVIEALLA